MKKALEAALGILTRIVGFLDVGAIATAAQAGAAFGFELAWAIVLGTICVIFLVEMSGRLATVSKHTLADAVRERFGFKVYVGPLCIEIMIDIIVLTAEIGGVCIALQLITGVLFQWWAIPVAFAVWVLLWKGTFGLIENGVALLGLVTLVFVAGAIRLRPALPALAVAALPTLPDHDVADYLFIAVSILCALISPYLFFFYSSGAVEGRWDEGHLSINRAVAGIGMGFGSVVSLGVLVCAALVLNPARIQVDRYEQAALILVRTFCDWGFIRFAASLGVCCFGAALESALDTASITAQAFGWNWGESQHPTEAARFALGYTIVVVLAAVPMIVGIDPLQLTLFTMAITAAILPIVVVPFLVLMNDERYVGHYRNGPITNTAVMCINALAWVLAIVATPLEIMGG